MSIFDKARIAILEDKTLWKGWSHLRGITFDFFREGRAPHSLTWEVFDRRNASAILLHNVERDTVTLSRHDAVRPQAIRYLNRLSDLLFVLSRVLARASGHGEVLWDHDRRR